MIDGLRTHPMLRDDYIALGAYLGYPICCIVAFGTAQSSPFSLHFDGHLEDIPLYGTGFVPCMRCALSKTAAELTATIQRQRLAPTVFPEATSPQRIAESAHFRQVLFSGELINHLSRSIASFTQTENRDFVEHMAHLSDGLRSHAGVVS